MKIDFNVALKRQKTSAPLYPNDLAFGSLKEVKGVSSRGDEDVSKRPPFPQEASGLTSAADDSTQRQSGVWVSIAI